MTQAGLLGDTRVYAVRARHLPYLIGLSARHPIDFASDFQFSAPALSCCCDCLRIQENLVIG